MPTKKTKTKIGIKKAKIANLGSTAGGTLTPVGTFVVRFSVQQISQHVGSQLIEHSAEKLSISGKK
jgi:hypothetical protein